MNKGFFGRIPLLVACFAGTALILAYSFAFGELSAQQLGVIWLVLVVALLIVFIRRRKIARRAPDGEEQPSSQERSRFMRARRRLMVAVVLLPLVGGLGLWSTRGEPLAPRLVGVAVSLSFTAALIWILVRTKERAKGTS